MDPTTNLPINPPISPTTDRSNTAAFAAYAGCSRIAAGTLAETAVAVRRALQRDDRVAILVFDLSTGEVVDLDLRGTDADVAARYQPSAATARRGRPKLGVVAREVTLLPRQWEWLATQPGGASVALRKLVDTARKQDGDAGKAQARIEAAYRFMSAIAGDLAGFEEASRALFARDPDGLNRCMQPWSADIRDQVTRFLDAGEAESRHH
jgi:uncharacterized protein